MKRDKNRKSPKLIYGHLRGPLKEIPVRGNRIVVDLDKFGAALEANKRRLSGAQDGCASGTDANRRSGGPGTTGDSFRSS